MLTHLENESGAPACGSTNPDPDLTADSDEVTCKQCLDARGVARAHEAEVATCRQDQASASGRAPRRARSEFLTYEEVLRICSKDSES